MIRASGESRVRRVREERRERAFMLGSDPVDWSVILHGAQPRRRRLLHAPVVSGEVRLRGATKLRRGTAMYCVVGDIRPILCLINSAVFSLTANRATTLRVNISILSLHFQAST